MTFSAMPLAQRSDSISGRARLVLAGASVAVFFTAFEVRQPVVDLGFFNLTTTKLAAVLFFLTVIAWALGDGVRSFLSRRALDVAVLLFLASNFISVPAAADKTEAFKFALRFIYAGGVYFGISRLPRRAGSHLVVAGAVTAAVLIVAAVGLFENFLMPVTWSQILSPFQEEVSTFGAFYNVRVASTLPYPTALSMYLELALPVALVLGIWLTGRQRSGTKRWWLALATAAGTTAVLLVQLFTFTRSGMVATPASFLIGALLAAVFGYGRRVWSTFAVVALLFLVFLGGSALFSGKMAARLGLRQQTNHYGAVYTLIDFPSSLKLKQQYSALVHIRNTGTITWGVKGSDDEVDAYYRWVRYPQGTEDDDVPFLISYMPRAISPGAEVNEKISFITPAQAGSYILEFDMIHVHRTAFSAAGVSGLQVPLQMNAGGSRGFVPTQPAAKFNETLPNEDFTPRSQLWRAALKMWRDHPLLGVGPDQFRNQYPHYINVSPDSRIRTHNIFMEALANTGAVGLAAMVFLLGWAAWVLLRLARARSMEISYRLVALALMVALAAYVGHGLADYFLWQTGVLFLFFALLGLIAWLDYKRKAPGL